MGRKACEHRGQLTLLVEGDAGTKRGGEQSTTALYKKLQDESF